MDFAWDTRQFLSAKHLTINGAIEHCIHHRRSIEGYIYIELMLLATLTSALVVADVTDNPGSGHYGVRDLINMLIIINNMDNR